VLGVVADVTVAQVEAEQIGVRGSVEFGVVAQRAQQRGACPWALAALSAVDVTPVADGSVRDAEAAGYLGVTGA
jgi:hypothetical protein